MENLDLNQQSQNLPNISQTPPPSMQQQSVPKQSGYWFWIVVAIIIAFGGLAWWYVNQLVVEAPIIEQPQVNKEARQDFMIQNEIDEADPGNLDKEFMEIDKDINNL